MKKLFFIAAVLALSAALCTGVFAETKYSLDALYVNENNYFEGVYSVYPAGSVERLGDAFSTELEIMQGDKIYVLGWFADTDYAVDRVVYRIDEEVEYECEDNYRDRTEIKTLGVPGFDDFDVNDFLKAGFGKDLGMMELVGIGDLAPGEYEFELVGKFLDTDEELIMTTKTLYVEERPLAIRDFNAETDKQYFDRILINGEVRAEGNDSVAALKAGVDGSDGSVATIGMYGWFGLTDTETPFADQLVSFGYIIDDGSPVFSSDFTAETAQDVLDLNGLRYSITADVSKLDDGQVHTVTGCVKLANNEVVIFNRESREAIISYLAPLAATPEPTEEPTPTPEPEDATSEPDDATTAPAANEDTEPAGNKTESSSKGGCGSVTGGFTALLALAAAAFVVKTKK